MKLSRRIVRWSVGLFFSAAVCVWLLQRPGVSFADRVDRLQPGMTFDEAEQVMGCPPGDYQTPIGEQCYPMRCVCFAPGSKHHPVFRSWNGDDGEVCVWGVSDSPQVLDVQWNRRRDRPRSNAESLWEEVSGWWEGVAKSFGG